MTNLHELDQKIAELQKLRDEEASRLGSLTETQKLAELLHDKKCPYSHEDQCSWHYENDANKWSTGYAHKRYLELTVKLTQIADAETIESLVNAGL